jgi:UDP-3-O-[3-hydroxymyristoyl] glucosamine N-acyltransferase
MKDTARNKELPSSLDAALGQVDPERRRLLGVMLAGAAALPLLTTTSLAQDAKTQGKVTPDAKNAWPSSTNSKVKNDTYIKADKSSNLKSDTYIKGSTVKTPNSGIKSDTSIKSDTYIKADSNIKADPRMKSSAAIKSQSTQVKGGANAPIKSNTAPQ